jgi:serine/threonine protein kinase
MARLVVIRGSDVGRVVALPSYPCVIGREDGCDVVIDDARMSRQHAVIRIARGTWMVRDLDTSNGTHVAARRTEGWTPIEDGARIQMGRTLFRLEEGTPEAPTEPADALPDVPGYEVLEVVGSGATGTVYRARREALGRIEAVKVLSTNLAQSARHVREFVKEARAAAALSHPHVVRVYDVGESGGLHWLSMEFMEGGTVEDLLLTRAGSRLPWREAVALASAAALGLAYVHRQGYVHRDIKPANLLLDADGVVKLGDLGTAVHVDAALAQRIGTPHFMSPEQARREPVTRASDVYALGATLYRMLAGRTPHRGDDLRAIVRAVADDEPTPIERLCRNLPAEVAQAVHEMMARDPHERPTDAGDVGRHLAEALEDVQTSRASRRAARRRRGVLGDWTARIVLLIAVAAALYLMRDAVIAGLREILDVLF